MTKAQKADMEAARETLRGMVSKGDTLYTVIRYVSRSGMRRVISVHKIHDGYASDLSRLTARACDFTYSDKHNGVQVDGCGMDMGFHIVNTLSVLLFCPDKYDHDAAYALKHRWM